MSHTFVSVILFMWKQFYTFVTINLQLQLRKTGVLIIVCVCKSKNSAFRIRTLRVNFHLQILMWQVLEFCYWSTFIVVPQKSENTEIPSLYIILLQFKIKPVCEESTDEAFCILWDVAVIGEGQGILVIHDLAVGAHQRVSVERRVTWGNVKQHRPLFFLYF